MRNICLVVYDLYNIIPDNVEEKFKIFKNQINKNILQSILYSPREQIRSNWYWNKLGYYTNKYISQDDYNNIKWCKQFIDIFLDPNYKIEDTSYHFD
tara:strand:+ start:1700 stop:1990 length:291 start_codon:yes stop_codon:yes gene_type:complete